MGSTAFKAAGTGDPRPAGSIPVPDTFMPTRRSEVLARPVITGLPSVVSAECCTVALKVKAEVTVPAGFSEPTDSAPLGVPVGMDILGRPFSEAKLLSLAYSFEQATNFRRPPTSAPPLPSEK